ncbi:hypothetical protein AAA075_04315, partial [Bacteroides intestinalis]
MTLKEFEDRTDLKPTSEEFDYIHDVYMHTSMNKDEFCKDFKKHGDSKIIRDVHVWKIQCKLPPKTKRFYPLKTFNNAPLKSLDRWGYYYFSLFPSV